MARALADLRAGAALAPSAAVRLVHLAAMQRAPEAPDTDVVVPRPRRRPGFVPKLVGATAAFVLAAGTGLAATGSLPDPAQDAVAGVVRRVGIDLPTRVNVPLQSAPEAAPAPPVVSPHAEDKPLESPRATEAQTACVAEPSEPEGSPTPGPTDAPQTCAPAPVDEQPTETGPVDGGDEPVEEPADPATTTPSDGGSGGDGQSGDSGGSGSPSEPAPSDTEPSAQED